MVEPNFAIVSLPPGSAGNIVNLLIGNGFPQVNLVMSMSQACSTCRFSETISLGDTNSVGGGSDGLPRTPQSYSRESSPERCPNEILKSLLTKQEPISGDTSVASEESNGFFNLVRPQATAETSVLGNLNEIIMRNKNSQRKTQMKKVKKEVDCPEEPSPNGQMLVNPQQTSEMEKKRIVVKEPILDIIVKPEPADFDYPRISEPVKEDVVVQKEPIHIELKKIKKDTPDELIQKLFTKKVDAPIARTTKPALKNRKESSKVETVVKSVNRSEETGKQKRNSKVDTQTVKKEKIPSVFQEVEGEVVTTPNGSNVKKMSCQFCQRELRISAWMDAARHVLTHGGGAWKCGCCMREYKIMATLRKHHRDLHTGPVQGVSLSSERLERWMELAHQCFPQHAQRLRPIFLKGTI